VRKIQCREFRGGIYKKSKIEGSQAQALNLNYPIGDHLSIKTQSKAHSLEFIAPSQMDSILLTISYQLSANGYVSILNRLATQISGMRWGY